MMKYIKLIAICLMFLQACTNFQQKNTDSKEVADSLKGTFRDFKLPIDERCKLLLEELTLEEKINQLRYDAPAINRLGIESYNWWNEALHGVARSGKATVFPQPIGLAATFDPKLIKNIADVISTEARAKYNIGASLGYHNQYGGLTFWSPNINIFRDPRWGRGMETWGEDPLLTGTMGSAFVSGLQGDHPTYLKAAACAKHFAVHSGPEADRHHFDAVPSLKDLNETYLPAFEMLVKKGKVEAVMCAYTKLFGEPCCGSSNLLQNTLRDEWGFEGHIMSDCWAINDFHLNHKVTSTAAESAALAIKSGVNLNCGDAYDSLMVAYKQKLVTKEDIDKALEKLLLTKFKLGMFDPADQVPFQYGPEVINQPKHVELARESAQKSIVLLKNNGVLPLKNNLSQLFIIGPMAANVDAMLGNYSGFSDNIVTIVEGLTGAVSPGTRLEYRKGFQMDRDNLNDIGWAISEAQQSEVTIVVMGIDTDLEGEEGESISSPTRSDRTNLKLPENQLKYLRKIRQNEGKPLIVVMTGGSPIAIEEVYNIADAVVWAWYPGEQGGNAVADVIFGKVSPSGKLPITFPKSIKQLPAYDDYTMNGRTYKYMSETPLFPFGFGLSYADFTYSMNISSESLSAESNSGEIVCSVTVQNNSEIEAEEVVQLYIAPKKNTNLPLYKLTAFDRVKVPANSSKVLSFNLSRKDFSYFNNKGELKLVEGEFDVFVAGSLPTERSIELGAKKAAVKTVKVL